MYELHIARTRTWTVGAAAALVLGASLLAVRIGTGIEATAAHGAPDAAPAPLAAAAVEGHDAAPHAGSAITDHPAPKTNSPEAAAAYASALQSLRDASFGAARDDLARAARLDPSFAAANLRLSLLFLRSYHYGREAFAAASQFRGALDERDLAILSFADAFTTAPGDFAQGVVRMRATAARYPDDAEVAFLLGLALEVDGRFDEARAAYARALVLDPEYAAAPWSVGRTYMLQNDEDRELAGYERCLEVSPMATSCLRSLAGLHEVRGQCAEFEADARRLVSVEPKGLRAYWSLARALAARGAPLESVRGALDEMVALATSAGSGEPAQLEEELVLALLAGDLARAASVADALERANASDMKEESHSPAVDVQMVIAEETGDRAAALRLGDDFERRRQAWTPDEALGVRLRRAYLLHAAGRLDDATFDRQRDGFYREEVAFLPPDHPNANIAWARTYLTPVETPADALDGITRLEARSPLHLRGLEAFGLGKVWALAGKPDAAMAPLAAAAKSCSILTYYDTGDWSTTVRFLRANELLGEVLEAKNDRAGACAAYGVVVGRWKDAKPRSATLEKARGRAKALGCAE
jgi:serine/threonine-protein kinase